MRPCFEKIWVSGWETSCLHAAWQGTLAMLKAIEGDLAGRSFYLRDTNLIPAIAVVKSQLVFLVITAFVL